MKSTVVKIGLIIGFRLASCISPQALRTFGALLEFWEFIVSCILNMFSCSSHRPTFSNRFVQKFLPYCKDHVHLRCSVADLCCPWICILECSGRGHLWLLFWVHSLLPPHCLWSFPLLFPCKVSPMEKAFRIHIYTCFVQLTLHTLV